MYFYGLCLVELNNFSVYIFKIWQDEGNIYMDRAGPVHRAIPPTRDGSGIEKQNVLYMEAR